MAAFNAGVVYVEVCLFGRGKMIDESEMPALKIAGTPPYIWETIGITGNYTIPSENTNQSCQ